MYKKFKDIPTLRTPEGFRSLMKTNPEVIGPGTALPMGHTMKKGKLIRVI